MRVDRRRGRIDAAAAASRRASARAVARTQRLQRDRRDGGVLVCCAASSRACNQSCCGGEGARPGCSRGMQGATGHASVSLPHARAQLMQAEGTCFRELTPRLPPLPSRARARCCTLSHHLAATRKNWSTPLRSQSPPRRCKQLYFIHHIRHRPAADCRDGTKRFCQAGAQFLVGNAWLAPPRVAVELQQAANH